MNKALKCALFFYVSSKIYIISYVIIAWLVRVVAGIGAGPPPPRLPVAGGPTRDRGTMQKLHITDYGRAHPLNKKKGVPSLPFIA